MIDNLTKRALAALFLVLSGCAQGGGEQSASQGGGDQRASPGGTSPQEREEIATNVVARVVKEPLPVVPASTSKKASTSPVELSRNVTAKVVPEKPSVGTITGFGSAKVRAYQTENGADFQLISTTELGVPIPVTHVSTTMFRLEAVTRRGVYWFNLADTTFDGSLGIHGREFRVRPREAGGRAIE